MVKKEKIINVPNFVTLSRVILAILLVVLFLFRIDIIILLYVFILATITDFVDGFLARRLNQVTNLGAKFDVIADRFLWIVFGLILIFGYKNQGYYNIFNFLLIFSREIVCGIFLVFYILISRKTNLVPSVRYGGKLTTLLQGITIPAMILSEKYIFFNFYEILIVLCGFFGLVNSLYYMFDMLKYKKLKNSKFKKYYDLLNPIAPQN